MMDFQIEYNNKNGSTIAASTENLQGTLTKLHVFNINYKAYSRI